MDEVKLYHRATINVAYFNVYLDGKVTGKLVREVIFWCQI